MSRTISRRKVIRFKVLVNRLSIDQLEEVKTLLKANSVDISESITKESLIHFAENRSREAISLSSHRKKFFEDFFKTSDPETAALKPEAQVSWLDWLGCELSISGNDREKDDAFIRNQPALFLLPEFWKRYFMFLRFLASDTSLFDPCWSKNQVFVASISFSDQPKVEFVHSILKTSCSGKKIVGFRKSFEPSPLSSCEMGQRRSRKNNRLSRRNDL